MEGTSKKAKMSRSFALAQHWTRRVALKVAYLGANYAGNTMSSPVDELTVESKLVDAMKRIKLLESLEASEWARAGRTDKGVSAWANVCTMLVRSNLRGVGATQCPDPGLVPPQEPPEKTRDCFDEMDYVHAINRALPTDIRVLAWSPVAADVNARFSCRSRTYRYYFLHDGLDVAQMQRACSLLLGEHDFRNFCQVDVRNRTSWTRTFHSATIESTAYPHVLMARFHATSFLHHQIRFIMATLFHVGRGLEAPDIVSRMLDVEKMTSKPSFAMASDVPLVLYQCEFDEGTISWRGSTAESGAFSLYNNFFELYRESQMRTAMLKDMVDALHTPELEAQRREREYATTRTYIPFADRPRSIDPQIKLASLRAKSKGGEEEEDGHGDE